MCVLVGKLHETRPDKAKALFKRCEAKGMMSYDWFEITTSKATLIDMLF
jgi:hypothetical protein